MNMHAPGFASARPMPNAHFIWNCSFCGFTFHTPGKMPPKNWALDPSTNVQVKCADCLEQEELAHVMRTADALTTAEAPAVRADKPSAPQMMHSGIIVDLLDPGAAPVKLLIDDIAHHLARICRFAGAPERHYSVAEHSVWVSRRLPDHLALAGLLHDASEAYLGDVTSPLKRCLPDYRAIEDRMNVAISAKFSVDGMFDAAVKRADLEMCQIEADRMMPHNSAYWGSGCPIANAQPIEYWSPEEATRRFLNRYDDVRHFDRTPPAIGNPQ